MWRLFQVLAITVAVVMSAFAVKIAKISAADMKLRLCIPALTAELHKGKNSHQYGLVQTVSKVIINTDFASLSFPSIYTQASVEELG
tara:strand:- start:305 stop:565 length:261 start_codon:yes stop_codon:yes gene_type:complete